MIAYQQYSLPRAAEYMKVRDKEAPSAVNAATFVAVSLWSSSSFCSWRYFVNLLLTPQFTVTHIYDNGIKQEARLTGATSQNEGIQLDLKFRQLHERALSSLVRRNKERIAHVIPECLIGTHVFDDLIEISVSSLVISGTSVSYKWLERQSPQGL